ncbi:response regulator [Flavobacteriaceae bacterium AU392]|nr:DNA-binding response regulator [Flavobacteriaceae bacterium]RKM84179.1 response regulator [Flavobacteriaceae bacterium AU392]
MAQKLKILMVDDHPMIIEGYKNTLQATKAADQELQIDIATNCDLANEMIKSSGGSIPYDMIFFDISLPPSKDGLITSGIDLAKIARQYLPKAKIIILTMFNESYRVHNIIKEINPEGFLIKSDLTSRELADAFQQIQTKPPYYSVTVINFLRASVTTNIQLDDISRKILYLLSQGIKTKSLTNHVGLSMSGIEKRKKQLKLLFSIEDGKDETLLKEAKEKGFI